AADAFLAARAATTDRAQRRGRTHRGRVLRGRALGRAWVRLAPSDSRRTGSARRDCRRGERSRSRWADRCRAQADLALAAGADAFGDALLLSPLAQDRPLALAFRFKLHAASSAGCAGTGIDSA